MGRKKIEITPIKDERTKHVTFSKRRQGLVKKAMELSILTSSEVLLIMFDSNGQLYEYSSNIDPKPIVQKYLQTAHTPHDRLSNQDLKKFDKPGKPTPKKRGNRKGDEEEDDSDEYEEDVKDKQLVKIQSQDTPTLPSMSENLIQPMTPTTQEAINRMLFTTQIMKNSPQPPILKTTPSLPPVRKRESTGSNSIAKKPKFAPLSIDIPKSSQIPILPTMKMDEKSDGPSTEMTLQALQSLGNLSTTGWTPNTLGLSPTPTGTFNLLNTPTTSSGQNMDYPSPKSETTQ